MVFWEELVFMDWMILMWSVWWQKWHSMLKFTLLLKTQNKFSITTSNLPFFTVRFAGTFRSYILLIAFSGLGLIHENKRTIQIFSHRGNQVDARWEWGRPLLALDKGGVAANPAHQGFRHFFLPFGTCLPKLFLDGPFLISLCRTSLSSQWSWRPTPSAILPLWTSLKTTYQMCHNITFIKKTMS